jgi:hypothetical protein
MGPEIYLLETQNQFGRISIKCNIYPPEDETIEEETYYLFRKNRYVDSENK